MKTVADSGILLSEEQVHLILGALSVAEAETIDGIHYQYQMNIEKIESGKQRLFDYIKVEFPEIWALYEVGDGR